MIRHPRAARPVAQLVRPYAANSVAHRFTTFDQGGQSDCLANSRSHRGGKKPRDSVCYLSLRLTHHVRLRGRDRRHLIVKVVGDGVVATVAPSA